MKEIIIRCSVSPNGQISLAQFTVRADFIVIFSANTGVETNASNSECIR